jgi:hypothetical protein
MAIIEFVFLCDGRDGRIATTLGKPRENWRGRNSIGFSIIRENNCLVAPDQWNESIVLVLRLCQFMESALSVALFKIFSKFTSKKGPMKGSMDLMASVMGKYYLKIE